jgi:hypothetical protein
MAKIKISKQTKQEIEEITEQLKRQGTNVGSEVELLWLEPGMMYTFICSRGGHWKAVKSTDQWFITKQ